MNKKRLTAFLTAVTAFVGIIPVRTGAADLSANKPEYAYFMNTWEDSSYVWLGSTIEGKGIDFMDGQEIGVTDSSNIYYNETVELDGLVTRKEYSANEFRFTVDSSVYDKGDTEFLFSMVYYDFGPSEGSFYLCYNSTDGTEKKIKLIKPGRNPGWTVKTVVADDVDFSNKYDDGSAFRITNGAYNAFKKIEVANISRAKRQNKEVKVTGLFNEVRRELEIVKIIPLDDERFTADKLYLPCTMYDAYSLRNEISTTKTDISDDAKNAGMTQGELLDYYMSLLGLSKTDGETSIEAARRYGIIDASGYFISDSTAASNYNLLSVAYGTLFYEDEKGKTLLEALYKNGKYEGIDVSAIKNDKFQEIINTPEEIPDVQYLPYKTITDPATKRTYHYINYFGKTLLRPYLSARSVENNGEGFICGLQTGEFFYYDIATQTLTYLDKTKKDTHTWVRLDMHDFAYYSQQEGKNEVIYKINIKTREKQKVYVMPEGLECYDLTVTNDGKYLNPFCFDNQYICERPKGTTALIRVDVENQKMEWSWCSTDYSVNLNHHEINPEYPELIAYSHETVSPWTYTDIWDRCNIMNIETGELTVYNQGKTANGKCVQLVTHELWSYDGEHRWFCSWAADGTKESGTMPAVVRIDKDGTHRQYYEGTMPTQGVNHANVDGSERMIATDQTFVALISAETHQKFPIVNFGSVIGSLGHPYHPHPQLSYTGNLVNWGHVDDDVLGVAWMDYTDILENEVAKGGRYQFGEDTVRVSYEGIECESKMTVKGGVECAAIQPGKSLFLDINSDIVDDDDAAIKLTFDYYDNTNRPLTLTYSKGVEEYNDAWKYFNKTATVQRTCTNKWRTAEIVINCGNFENIGKFESDFKISSGGLNAYIANVKVERLEHK